MGGGSDPNSNLWPQTVVLAEIINAIRCPYRMDVGTYGSILTEKPSERLFSANRNPWPPIHPLTCGLLGCFDEADISQH